jgi:hypothetical protein
MDGLSNYHLKWMAAISMLVDHVGLVFFPEQPWLRTIGRLSFPLFVWLLVQGESHTRHVGRYGLRLVVLAVISQPVYQLAFQFQRLNVVFLLLIGLVCLRLVRRYPAFQVPIWLLGAALSDLLKASYGSYGIALVVLVYYFHPHWRWWLVWVGFHLIWVGAEGTFQLPAVVAAIFFGLANGQRGPKAGWFYGFYPGHLALLVVVRWLITHYA